MALSKVNYVNDVTVITAENLNDIQDEIIALEASSGDGLTEDIKQALLQIAQKLAYIDDQGATYYQDLYDALYPPATLVSIDAVFTQGSTVVYDTASLDSLKSMLVVTGTYDDATTATIPSTDYTLSGTLTAGTSTITASYGGKTASFTVTVTEAPLLPTEYQQVEYIENPNGAYITTSVNFPAKFEAYVKSQMSSAPTGNAKIAFGGKNNSYNYGLVAYSTSSLYIGAFCGNNNTFVKLTDLYASPAETTVTVDTVNNTVAFDATNASANASKTGASIGNITSVAIRVFWYGDATQQFVGKIFEVSVKNTETDAEVLHLYPCYRKADSKVGMYDVVNSAFYPSDTSTNFTKGGDVA